jgi:hypothetical protein
VARVLAPTSQALAGCLFSTVFNGGFGVTEKRLFAGFGIEDLRAMTAQFLARHSGPRGDLLKVMTLSLWVTG